MRKRLFGVLVLFFASGWILAQTGTITSPKANDVWMLGDTKAITWTHTGQDTVKLFLLDQNKKKLGIIKSALQLSAGSWPWTVGSLEGGLTVPPAKGYRIEMKLAGEAIVLDPGAGPFEIAPAATGPAPIVMSVVAIAAPGTDLKVTKPMSGTQVMVGGTCPVAWSLSAACPTVKIMVCRAGQLQWDIAASTANDGSFDWKLDGTERTGRYVVRVQTPDGKVHGDSGEFTIVATTLPPDQHTRVVAGDPELPDGFWMYIDDPIYNYDNKCVASKVHMNFRIVTNTQINFGLSPNIGHPQYGSLFLRCLVERPQMNKSGNLSAVKIYDRIYSLKGGGASLKILDAQLTKIAPSEYRIKLTLDMVNPIPIMGLLVLQKQSSGIAEPGGLCQRYFYPKMTIFVSQMCKKGEAQEKIVKYLISNQGVCPPEQVFLPGETSNCTKGVNEW